MTRSATIPARRSLALVLGLCVLLPLVVAACEIVEVIQPSEADQGEIIEIFVTVEQPFADANPHRGVLSVLVPEDWVFVGGTYDGDGISGDMVEDEGWSDSTEIVVPAPAGMKWIATLSEEAHDVPAAPAFFDATLQFQVGQTLGTFDLGYFTTNDAFNTADIQFGPNEENTADTLMNQPITVNPLVATEDETQPGTIALDQNYPNPFAASTTIGYTLDRAANVRLVVFDAAGREVAIVAESRRAAGGHTVTFDGSGLPSGTYLYRLEADGETIQTRRMTLVK